MTRPPVYPLTREVFNRALTTGHGRALIHAEYFDLHDHRDDILDAGATCRVYDPQVDGHREWWLPRRGRIPWLPSGERFRPDPEPEGGKVAVKPEHPLQP